MTSQPRTQAPLLYFCGFMIGFCFFGMISVLALKLQQSFSLNDSYTYEIIGLSTSLSFAMLLPSGYLSDRFLGVLPATVLGFLMLMIACPLLAMGNLSGFLLGLSLYLVGLSLAKVNCTTLIGSLAQNPQHRERHLTYYYGCLNAGSVVGPITLGAVAIYLGWTWVFTLLGALLLLLLAYVAKALLFSGQRHKTTDNKIFYLVPFAFCGLFSYLFHHTELNNVVLILFVIAIMIFFIHLLRQQNQQKKPLKRILLLNCIAGCFFIFSLQTTSSVTLFIQRDLHRVFHHIEVPTTAFTALDPLFVTLSGPFFIMLWRFCQNRHIQVNLIDKILISMGCATLTLLLLSLSAHFSAGSHIFPPIFLVILANLFIGAGEMCIIPPILSAITQHAPSHLRSTMIGCWYVFIAIAGFIAAKLAKTSNNLSVSASNKIISCHIYQQSFFHMMLIAGGIFLSIFIANKLFFKQN